MSNLIRNKPSIYETFQKEIENLNPEICTNVIICFIKITQFLLTRQTRSLEEDFMQYEAFAKE